MNLKSKSQFQITSGYRFVEEKLKENQSLKDELAEIKEVLGNQVEESVADDLKIFELQREIKLKEIAKEVEIKAAKEKAMMIGGEEEAAKVDEDYDVKQSRLKAQEILQRMRNKLEKANQI